MVTDIWADMIKGDENKTIRKINCYVEIELNRVKIKGKKSGGEGKKQEHENDESK